MLQSSRANATDADGQTTISISSTSYSDAIEERRKIYLTVTDTTGRIPSRVIDVFFIEKSENQHGSTVYKRSDGHETVVIKGLTLDGIDVPQYTDSAGNALPYLSVTDSDFTRYYPPRVGRIFPRLLGCYRNCFF